MSSFPTFSSWNPEEPKPKRVGKESSKKSQAKEAQISPVDSSLFSIDKRGDVANLQFQSNSNASIPKYSRTKTILGTRIKITSQGTGFALQSQTVHNKPTAAEWRAFSKKVFLSLQI